MSKRRRRPLFLREVGYPPPSKRRKGIFSVPHGEAVASPETDFAMLREHRCPRCWALLGRFTDETWGIHKRCERCKIDVLIRGPLAPSEAEVIARIVDAKRERLE